VIVDRVPLLVVKDGKTKASMVTVWSEIGFPLRRQRLNVTGVVARLPTRFLRLWYTPPEISRAAGTNARRKRPGADLTPPFFACADPFPFAFFTAFFVLPP
jgi:hypothetical protein